MLNVTLFTKKLFRGRGRGLTAALGFPRRDLRYLSRGALRARAAPASAPIFPPGAGGKTRGSPAYEFTRGGTELWSERGRGAGDFGDRMVEALDSDQRFLGF